jgi:CRISPR-associated protein Csm3
MRLNQIVDLRGEIELLTGLHIGAGDLEMRIGGVDNAVIRDPRTNLPYVPGSSLKGKIRSLLEWRSGAVREAPLGLSDLKGVEKADEPAVLAILQLFGISGDAQMSEADALRIGPSRISFHDAHLVEDPRAGSNAPITEVKSENSINRIKGVALNPRQTERVAAGVRFAFRVTVKALEGDGDLVSTLLAGMRLLELDSLGGSGSRGYGKVRFVDLRLDGADIQQKFQAIDPFASFGAAA